MSAHQEEFVKSKDHIDLALERGRRQRVAAERCVKNAFPSEVRVASTGVAATRPDKCLWLLRADES
jgi:hypothetical protein